MRQGWDMANENLSAREDAAAKGKNELDHAIMEFGKCVVALRDLLDQDRSLNDIGMLFIENHFYVLQMAYVRWKRKQSILSANLAGNPPLNYDARSSPILAR